MRMMELGDTGLSLGRRFTNGKSQARQVVCRIIFNSDHFSDSTVNKLLISIFYLRLKVMVVPQNRVRIVSVYCLSRSKIGRHLHINPKRFHLTLRLAPSSTDMD